MMKRKRIDVRKRIKRTVVFLLSTVFFMLCGCGPTMQGITATTLILHEDGAITQVVVESFDREYYDFDEMKEEITQEVSSYNSRQGEDRIRITECKKQESNVRLVMEYAADADYVAFNRVEFSYAPADGQVIVSEPVHVRTVRAIDSVSEGVEILSDREVKIDEAVRLPATITTKE